MISTEDDVVAHLLPLSDFSDGDVRGLIDLSARAAATGAPEDRQALADVLSVYELQGRAPARTVWQSLSDALDAGSEIATKLAPILSIVLMVA